MRSYNQFTLPHFLPPGLNFMHMDFIGHRLSDWAQLLCIKTEVMASCMLHICTQSWSSQPNTDGKQLVSGVSVF